MAVRRVVVQVHDGILNRWVSLTGGLTERKANEMIEQFHRNVLARTVSVDDVKGK